MTRFLLLIFSLTSLLYGIDRDFDGLEDVWQWVYNASDLLPDEDEDRDGHTNVEECVAGTDPRDYNSKFDLVDFNLERSDTGITLQWDTERGKVYSVFQKDTLPTSSWTGEIEGTGKTLLLEINPTGSTTLTSDKNGLNENLLPSAFSLPALTTLDHLFFKISVADKDTDNDGLSDWAEEQLKDILNLNPTLPQSTPGIDDADLVSNWYNANKNIIPEVSLVSSDRCAFENNAPLAGEDNAELTITRTGILPINTPLFDMGIQNTGNTSVICNGQCCMVVGVAGDEAAEKEDYIFLDEEGLPVNPDSIQFKLGQAERKITVKAINDGLYEYPETLNVAAQVSSDGSYTLSTTNGGSIQFLDTPNEPENEIIFIGSFSQDARATLTTKGSGFLSAKINGNRTEVTITTNFSNLTSAQQDCHVHKSNVGAGATPGAIIFAITEIPYDESSDPLNGPLSNYPWDLKQSSGAVPSAGGAASKQVIIDSLFSQNGETPLYLNVHTVSNPAGEIWSFFSPSSGSQLPPGDPAPAAAAGSTEFPLLTGKPLEIEVRRFLDQATFGAKEAEVATLVQSIENERLSNSTYHRVEAFENWINNQINIQQTYHVDYMTAEFWQTFDVAGAYDPTRNPTYTDGDGNVVNTPVPPSIWPSVDRSNPDPEKWIMTQPFPFTPDELRLIRVNNLQEPNTWNNRSAAYTIYNNGKDQLRQKLGYSLQQILLVSNITGEINDQLLAFANYQDMLNNKAFTSFRELLGYVNNSPIMGNWLTSLMNQKEADLDGDMIPDVFADENLARENMQLFSIGLFELWEDGSLRLDSSGNPTPTYDNEDIKEFSKIITGQSYSKNINTNNDLSPSEWGGVPYESLPNNSSFSQRLNQNNLNDIAYYYPMTMFPEYHDQSEVKTIVGGKQISNFSTISLGDGSPETLKALAQKDLEDALDWLAGIPNDNAPDFDNINSHGSTPAFICKRLIQRLVTSNPTKDYLHRVSRSFINTEGDIEETIKAILLDPAARHFSPDDYTFGIKKNPIESYIQLTRKLQAVTGVPLQEPPPSTYPFQYLLGDFNAASNPRLYLENFGYPANQLNNFSDNFRHLQNTTIKSNSSGLQIELMQQPTVFNWYVPDYSPSGQISAAGLVSPEMQLLTDSSIMRNINYLEVLTRDVTDERTETRMQGVTGSNFANRKENQRYLFGADPATSSYVDDNDNIQLPVIQISDTYYPQSPITDTVDRTGESLADEALIDSLDEILTYGLLKHKYPYNSADNDDPNTPEIDESLKNPRECIIDMITAEGNPWNDDPTAALDNKVDKVRDALWLISFTPEFQIRK